MQRLTTCIERSQQVPLHHYWFPTAGSKSCLVMSNSLIIDLLDSLDVNCVGF